MRLLNFLYTCLATTFVAVLILFLSEVSFTSALIIVLLSATVITSTHAALLQALLIPFLKKQELSITSQFFLSMIPWILVSLLLLCWLPSEAEVYAIIAIQYGTVTFTHLFEYSETHATSRTDAMNRVSTENTTFISTTSSSDL